MSDIYQEEEREEGIWKIRSCCFPHHIKRPGWFKAIGIRKDTPKARIKSVDGIFPTREEAIENLMPELRRWERIWKEQGKL